MFIGTATLIDGTEVKIIDRTYVELSTGETILASVKTMGGQIAARRVAYITIGA